jgi:PIN domain nuclease of toxin-antitoxin system
MPQHHRDPFDRLLIAQAMVDQMQVVSADAAFDAHPIQRLWS